MRNLHNVEPSAFTRGAYVGYDASGNVWRITRDGRGWAARATKLTAAAIYFHRLTLTEVSRTLEGLQ